MTFEQFFTTATRDAEHPNGNAPYDYQRRLAVDSSLEGCGPQHPTSSQSPAPFPCRSQLIEFPTGLGKPAAVVMAWLVNVAIGQDSVDRARNR